jgi:hypothetical protein
MSSPIFRCHQKSLGGRGISEIQKAAPAKIVIGQSSEISGSSLWADVRFVIDNRVDFI